jgi:nicotinate-nucleotide pyrophosphorylase (carboxylating)
MAHGVFPMSGLPPSVVDDIVGRALAEDLGSGDITSTACIEEHVQAVAVAVTRHPLVVCGGAVFARAFTLLEASTAIDVVERDGAQVEAGAILWRVRGGARSVLGAERVALNFVQRMCGIATLARRYVAALAPGSRTRIVDTRKTTPGLRILERYAVRTGGAHNHRDNLGAAVMIKDNHIVAAGSITTAIERAQIRAPHSSRIEVEVTTLDELDEALAAGADIIMLDNMDTPSIERALERVRAAKGPRPIIEASGGITLDRVRELSAAGVDVISVGALTHSAPAADISLELEFDR